MTYTDYGIGLLSLLFFFIGWQRGLFRSLLGPLSLVICSIAGVIYYDVSDNLVKSVMIALGGTFVLSIVLRILITIGRSTADETCRNKTFLLSRLLGGLVNLGWKLPIMLGLLFLLTRIPFNFFHLDTIKDDIRKSLTFDLLNTYVLNQSLQVRSFNDFFEALNNPEDMSTITQSREYTAFISDPKMEELLADEDIKALISEKRYTKLLLNPKVRALLKDEKLMSKLTDLSKKIYSETLQEEAAAKE